MALTEKAKALRTAKHREWQRKNKDKVKLYNERYWNRLAEKLEQPEEEENEHDL